MVVLDVAGQLRRVAFDTAGSPRSARLRVLEHGVTLSLIASKGMCRKGHPRLPDTAPRQICRARWPARQSELVSSD
jgi:hypothetical protein